jgi:hypothetical protein
MKSDLLNIGACLTKYRSGKGNLAIPVLDGSMPSSKLGKVQRIGQTVTSEYAAFSTQGAIILPRVAFMVVPQVASPLGAPHGRIAVESSRSVQEKRPWRQVPTISAVVESEFIRPILNGDNLLPFRIGAPSAAVIPCGRAALLSDEVIESYPGLQHWWGQASRLWEEHRSNDSLSLMANLDWQSKLTKQLPIASLRVIYNKSGMHICAAKLRNHRALVSAGLYWAAVQSDEEADYLCAILNSPSTTELTRPFMSYGKDERDIHKHVWELPVPMYNPSDSTHRRIASFGAAAAEACAQFDVDPNLHFAATRRHMRDLLFREQFAELDELVFQLLS